MDRSQTCTPYTVNHLNFVDERFSDPDKNIKGIYVYPFGTILICL